MKKSIVFVCLLVFCFPGFARQKKSTSNKEIQDKIKETQRQLDQL